MIVNLVVIFLILIIGHFFNRIYKLNSDTNYVRKKYIKFICVILILQSGLRNVAVGEDTYNYFNTYRNIKTKTWVDIYNTAIEYYKTGNSLIRDPGYAFFQKTVQLISKDFQFFLFVIAIIFFSAFGTFVYRNTKRLKDVILAFLIYSVLFYSFFSYTGQRQTIATALILVSYEFIKKKKILPFLFLVLIASTIHKSALIFIPFYFINQIKKTKNFYRIVLLLFPIIMVYSNNLANFFIILGGYELYNQYEGAGSYTFTTIFLVISVVALLRSKIILKHNPNAQHYYNAFAIALLFLPLTWFNPSAMRVVQYFSIFMVLFIPEIIHSFNHISVKIGVSIAKFTIILLIILFIKSNWNNSMPYGFFWEDMHLPGNYYLRG
ncbi:EpsG family protein [Lutibacter sp.]|uniref:EpsG family protein n=1 Tax=Lutibacter sp. TaxID=1925666 RepID=UPI0025C6B132|nr:EpsG family protein [Lutibacter sp.]MCF6182105.1 EpsG family protein [Lutibacter sp.]